MILELITAFILGVIVQRVYQARVQRGLFRQGSSWGWFNYRWWRKLHGWYCEVCPRRGDCATYKVQMLKKDMEGKLIFLSTPESKDKWFRQKQQIVRRRRLLGV